jgi:poly-D-alanine transfer protein DltD
MSLIIVVLVAVVCFDLGQAKVKQELPDDGFQAVADFGRKMYKNYCPRVRIREWN